MELVQVKIKLTSVATYLTLMSFFSKANVPENIFQIKAINGSSLLNTNYKLDIN